MPWETEGEGVRFDGPLADFMGAIMTAYDQDVSAGVCQVSAGVYVTATAIVLRELLLESLTPDDDTREFLVRVSEAMNEDDEGNVEISTFALLDDIAEHIELEALEAWLGSSEVRDAIADVSSSAFPVE
jgi:hypothetical protein